jgi:hypothetical protein
MTPVPPWRWFMRPIALIAFLVALLVSASCGGTSTPVSPSAAPTAAVGAENGSQVGGAGTSAPGTAPAIGLTGVVRDLNTGAATFSLLTREGTRTILMDGDTQVWSRGTQVRVSALRDGQSVSIRGYDHTRYILARTISVN